MFHFSTNDPLGRKILLPDHSWQHIQYGHPEFATWTSVETTVNKPNVVRQSVKKPDRDIYYKLGALGTYPPLYVAVVVGFKGDTGNVITAHLTADFGVVNSGGIKYVSRK